jgi:hypothetical protein
LGLFSLLLAQYLMDISHERPPLGTVCFSVAGVNEAGSRNRYARNLPISRTEQPDSLYALVQYRQDTR